LVGLLRIARLKAEFGLSRSARLKAEQGWGRVEKLGEASRPAFGALQVCRMTDFRPDPAFEAGSIAATDWPLCHVRLQDDARFPWLILIPRRTGLVELEDLDLGERTALMEEQVRAGALVRRLGHALNRPIDKLNIAAIGNVTAQLHIHIVGRRRDDGLWPDPVWGRPGARFWPAEKREQLIKLVLAG
jgi:diadenosine tetraphosphate (Ap4A) HIT family hydrolase